MQVVFFFEVDHTEVFDMVLHCAIYSGHRGFAFVEYVTRKDAKNAMAELSNTHFYGRHLVVDWVRYQSYLSQVQINQEVV